MHLDKHILIGLRGTQFISGIVVMSLCAYIDEWTIMNSVRPKHAAAPIGFLIFTSVISTVATTFLTTAPCFLSRPLHKYFPAALSSFVSTLYLGGFIALSIYLASLSYCRGSVCDAAKSSLFFSGLSSIAWLAEAVILILGVIRGQRNNALSMIKDDYEDHVGNEDPDDNEEDDHQDGFQRKHIVAGEKLSDVKL